MEEAVAPHLMSAQGPSCVTMDPSCQSIKLPVFEMLQQLREKQLYCDLVFEVEDTKFFCHRAIVAAWSPFIHSMLNMNNVVKEVVRVDYSNVGVFSTFLDYMYSRDLDLGDVDVVEVLNLATSFQVESFRDMCEAVFQCNLHMGNIISTFQLAHKFRLSGLEDYSLSYLQMHLPEAVKQNEFLNLSAVALNTFLSSGIVVNVNPEVKLFLIVSWLGYDVKEREQYFVVLLGHIDWSAVAQSFLRDISQTDNFFSTNESSLYLLLHILDCTAIPLGPYTDTFPELQKKYSYLLSQVVEDSVLKATSDIYTPVPIQLMPSFQTESYSKTMTGFERGQKCKSRIEQEDPSEVSQVESNEASKIVVYIDFDNGNEEDADTGPPEDSCNMSYDNDPDFSCGPVTPHKENSEEEQIMSRVEDCNGESEKLVASLPGEREEEREEQEKKKTKKKKKKGGNPELRCPRCSYVARNKQLQDIHIKQFHDNWVPYKCMFCDFVCHWSSEYFLHYKRHYRQGPPYVCDYDGCDLTHARLPAIVTHRESHFAERRWLCYKCPSKFKLRLDLLCHLRRCHKKNSEKEREMSRVEVVSTADDLQKLVASFAREREEEREEHEKKKKEKKDGKTHLNCPICLYVAQNEQLQDIHIKQSHEDWVPYKCMFCDFVCHWNPEYFLHYKQHFHQGPPYVCDYHGCDQTYARLTAFVTHRESHLAERRWQCQKCSSTFKVRRNLLCHMRSCHKEKSETERGALCVEDVSAADDLQKLVASLARERLDEQDGETNEDTEEIHSRYVPKRGNKGCPLCSYVARNQQQHDDHMKRCHEGGLPFKCMLCDFVCHCHKVYFLHCKEHYQGPPYRCDHEGCNLNYARISSLVKHKETHAEKSRWECEECHTKFKLRCSLLGHIKKCHHGDRPFACEQCSRKFATKFSLDRHTPEHSGRNYVCDKCSYTTKFQSSYQEHCRIHTGERPFKCKVCQRGFRTKPFLKSHAVIHAERSFRCNICSFTTHHRHRLSAHYRRHTGDAFYCHFPQCSYASEIRTELRAHMRAHLGIRRYVCPTCGKGFVEKKQLVNHKRLHSATRPYKCKQCDYSTDRAKTLKSHVIYNHGDTPPKITKCRKRLLKKSKRDPEQIPQSGIMSEHSYGQVPVVKNKPQPSILQSLLKHTLPPSLLPEQQTEQHSQQPEQQQQTERQPQQQPKPTTPRKRTIITLIKRRITPAHADTPSTATSSMAPATAAATTTTTAATTSAHPESTPHQAWGENSDDSVHSANLLVCDGSLTPPAVTAITTATSAHPALQGISSYLQHGEG